MMQTPGVRHQYIGPDQQWKRDTVSWCFLQYTGTSRQQRIFRIDVFLLDIDDNIDVVLGMPWLTRLGCVAWDVNAMELLYYHNGRANIFRAAPRHQASSTMLALPAPQPMVHLAWSSSTHVPQIVINRSQHARYPTALDNVNNMDDVIFNCMRQAAMEEELRFIDGVISEGQAANVWSMQ
jgi:hypothetical protein